MKIKIKTIKQELKRPDDQLKTQIIHAFIDAREGQNHSELINSLKSLGIDPCQAVSYLNKEEVAPQLYTKAVETHNSFCKNQIKVDAFGDFPKIGHDQNQTPGSNKNTESGRNFMQENNMKISKNYLKQIIAEELTKIVESSDEDWDEDSESFQKWKKGKDIEPEEDDEEKEQD